MPHPDFRKISHPRPTVRWLLAGAVGCGLVWGVVAHESPSFPWLFMLCILSALLVGAAQQTLP